MKAGEAGPGISASLREAFGKLSAAAEAEKDYVTATKYLERLLVAQEALHRATKGRGTHASDATTYSGPMQATLAKLGMRKFSCLSQSVCTHGSLDPP